MVKELIGGRREGARWQADRVSAATWGETGCGKRAMGSGKCVAHSEAPAPSPKPKKRYRSPERTCYGGDGSKECPILLDSPLWVKDHKDMKKLLALWVDQAQVHPSTGIFSTTHVSVNHPRRTV